MNIILDIGNSRGKIYFHNKYIELYANSENLTIKFFENLLKKANFQFGIVSYTGHKPNDIIGLLNQKLQKLIELDTSTKLPFNNFYKSKETLGPDRIAALAGLMKIFPNQSSIIIDTGTAITYDILKHGVNYFGGNISPGLDIRFKALNTFTAKLPLCSQNKNVDFFGTDTNSAIISGVQNGIVAEINMYIDQYLTNEMNHNIILTGGNSIFFAPLLKKAIFVSQNIVALGLSNILEYNINNTF